jgi:microcystin-dependent protein
MNNLQALTDCFHALNIKTYRVIHDLFGNLSFHVGEYKWSSRVNDFNGWLKCDGRSLSREDYAELFEVLGTSFGADDSLTFKLPDLRGRVMGCVGQGSGLTNRTLGALVGQETHTLISNEIPGHTHTGTTNSSGSHTHGITDPGHTHSQTTINDDFNSSGASPPGFVADSAGTRTWNNINSNTTGITVNSDGSHIHTFTTNSTGGGLPHNNMQPTAFVGNVFIFAKYIPNV